MWARYWMQGAVPTGYGYGTGGVPMVPDAGMVPDAVQYRMQGTCGRWYRIRSTVPDVGTVLTGCGYGTGCGIGYRMRGTAPDAGTVPDGWYGTRCRYGTGCGVGIVRDVGYGTGCGVWYRMQGTVPDAGTVGTGCGVQYRMLVQ
jgi:hypothetical protein